LASTARIAMSGNEIVGSAVPHLRPPRSETAATGGRRVEMTVGIERAVVRLVERAVGLVERAVGFGVTIVGLWAGRAVA